MKLIHTIKSRTDCPATRMLSLIYYIKKDICLFTTFGTLINRYSQNKSKFPTYPFIWIPFYSFYYRKLRVYTFPRITQFPVTQFLAYVCQVVFFTLVESLREFHVCSWILSQKKCAMREIGLALIVWYFLRWTSTMFVSITDNSNKIGKIFLLICQSSTTISFTGILSPCLLICITISTITAHLNWQKDKFNFPLMTKTSIAERLT